MTSSHNPFKEAAVALYDAGYSVIPGEYGTKKPKKGLKAWSRFCEELPSNEQREEWLSDNTPCNIDLCLGPASGIVVLDVDTDNPDILSIILPLLPSSPVEKVGSKGFTRFFRYMGEKTTSLEINGHMICEVLSNKKKTTLPPSKHPTGVIYTWTGKSLQDFQAKDLPILPPFLLSALEHRIKFNTSLPSVLPTQNIATGRNNALSSFCGQLISNSTPLSEAIPLLIEEDNKNPSPLFKDVKEMGHDEVYTNALRFYSSHVHSVNSRRHYEKQLYFSPVFVKNNPTQAAIIEIKSDEKEKEVLNQESPKLPDFPEGALQDLKNHILDNSFVPQPAFATGASLAFMGVLIGRKINFAGAAPNIYALNLGPSGCGKDAPQQIIKKVMVEIGAEAMLGCGDYVSDASLMDQLPIYPSRLDIIDEASGILRSVSKKAASYNMKMSEVLCELYTASTSVFTGRMTAAGPKGYCVRPNVNLLCSTTPASFSGAITTENLESGLLGRFLIFQGNYSAEAGMRDSFKRANPVMIDFFKYLRNFRPGEGEIKIGHGEYVVGAKYDPKVKVLIESFFSEFDKIRTELDSSSIMLPIAARLFQFFCKVALISACSNYDLKDNMKVVIREEDLKFAHDLVKYYYSVAQELVDKFVHKTPYEKIYNAVFNIIKSHKVILLNDLNKKTKFLKPKEREEIINDLLKTRSIDLEPTSSGEQVIVFNHNYQAISGC